MSEEALKCKEKGNTEFLKKTESGYELALQFYAEGLTHDASNHVLHANSAACHLELATMVYDAKKKVKAYGLALQQALSLHYAPL